MRRALAAFGCLGMLLLATLSLGQTPFDRNAPSPREPAPERPPDPFAPEPEEPDEPQEPDEAAEPGDPSAPEAPDDPGTIVLEECRITLLDEVVLASQQAGRLKLVGPGEGDRVEAGEQVVVLDDRVAQAALAVAEKEAENNIEIRYARKAADVAQVEYERSVAANRDVRGTVPEIEVRRLQLAAERSRLQIEQAEHQLEINRLTRDRRRAELETLHLAAPFSGVVTRLFHSTGETVRPGDPILELASTSRVRVEGHVDIREIWSVERGAPVEVQLEIPEVDLEVEEEVFKGRIAFVDLRAEPVTRRWVRVWAEVENHENILRAGLTARMTIHTDRPVAAKDDAVTAAAD